MEFTEESNIDNQESFFETILHYLSQILKYKILIIAGTTIAAIAVSVYAYMSIKLPADRSPMPNIYRAYGVLLFQENGGSNNMSSMLSAFGVDPSSGSSSASTLALQILNSRQFMDNVVEHFNLIVRYRISENKKNQSRLLLKNNSQYYFNSESGSLRISYTAVDPVFAADVVNYTINLLEEWFIKQGVSTRSNELSLMEEKLKELTSDIQVIEEDIKTFQKENGVLDIREMASTQSAMLTELRTNLYRIELEIEDYLEFSTIKDAGLSALKRQRDNIITQIKHIEAGYISSDGRKMPSFTELPQLSQTFAHMQAELSLKNQLYLTLSERYEVTKLMFSDADSFSVLEYAEVPEEKEGPMRGKMCIMVTFGTFFALVVLALFLDYIKKIIFNPKYKKILLGEVV